MKTRHMNVRFALLVRGRGLARRFAVIPADHELFYRPTFRRPRPAQRLLVRWCPVESWLVPIRSVAAEKKDSPPSLPEEKTVCEI